MRPECETGREGGTICLRLFGLRGPRMDRIEEEPFPFSAGLTVAELWRELQGAADPDSVLAQLRPENTLALVNGVPIQRLAGWDTVLAAGDTLTLMVKAFGG